MTNPNSFHVADTVAAAINAALAAGQRVCEYCDADAALVEHAPNVMGP